MKLYLGLTGPLLWFIWLPLVLLGLVILLIKVKTWMTRAYLIPLYLVVAYVIPLGDVTLNSWHMAKVCPNAGLHVYRTVVVDGFFGEYTSDLVLKKYPYTYVEWREFDDSKNVRQFVREGNGIIEKTVAKPLSQWGIFKDKFDSSDKIQKVIVDRVVIKSLNTNELIAEEVGYTARMGWLDAKISSWIDNPIGGCYSKSSIFDEFQNILIRRNKK